MKKVLLICIVIMSIGCKSKSNNNFNNNKAKKSLIVYYKENIKDAVSIDSIFFDCKVYTEKEKNIDNSSIYLTGADLWNETNHGTTKIDTAKSNAYRRMFNKLFELSKTSDSVTFQYWKAHVMGIYTKKDMTLGVFTHELFLTKDYKIVERGDVIDLNVQMPVSYLSDKVLTLDYSKDYWEIMRGRKEYE
jgi:hypothetical protein